MMVWTELEKGGGLGETAIAAGIGSILLAVFALPFAYLGLLPLAAISEIIGRNTRVPAILVAVIGCAAAALTGHALFPLLQTNGPVHLGAFFGASVFLAWIVLTFSADSMNAQWRRSGGNFEA